jgi:hypothetical protein
MAIQTFTAAQVLTAAQMNALQANDYNQTVSTKTANYVLVAADKGTRVVMNSATATTITVNTSLFAAGDSLRLQNINSGATVVTAGTATVTSAGSLSIPQWGGGQLYFTSASAAVYFPDANTSSSVSIFSVSQASGTNGGTATSGSWLKIGLNTTVVNGITSCTLTSGVISLPAGTYTVEASNPFAGVNDCKIKLYNTTDAADTIIGTSGSQSGAAATQVIRTSLLGVFTSAGTKNYELQYRVSSTLANYGLGINNSFSVAENYALITITKTA